MNRLHASPLLRLALRLDAAASLGVGLITAALAEPLTALIGAPQAWVLGAGLFMMAYGVAVGWLSTRVVVARALAWGIVIGNLLWSLHTSLLGFSSLIEPTPLGLGMILGQAAAVILLAALQCLGLQRSLAQASA